MVSRMNWTFLLNEERRNKKKKDPNDHRNEFEKDYDRIVSSSSLRRLQDKAQVYPLQNNDFIRTRLTHSLEVSAIARSFGNWLEKWLITNKHALTESDRGKIPAILAVTGLVHDIGNPPFGHYGEDIIKNWFDNWFKKNPNYESMISEAEKNDFLSFDGNAQAIRILTSLQFLNNNYGINFTYGTLSVLMKYPWDSSYKNPIDKKKFGYFVKDETIAKDIINNTVQMTNVRNPLTYLLEASDDIAYLGADLEDSVKKNVIPWEKEFANIVDELKEHYPSDIHKINNKHNRAVKYNFPDKNLTSVQNFKVWAQSQMIREVKEAFKNNYDDIMEGKFIGKELLEECSKACKIKEILQRLANNYCYPNREVLSLELVGDSVLNGLLDIFVNAIINTSDDIQNKTKTKDGKLYKLISDNFIFVHLLKDNYEQKMLKELSIYDKLLLITDFISGMTDSYAVDLHQKLQGVKMP